MGKEITYVLLLCTRNTITQEGMLSNGLVTSDPQAIIGAMIDHAKNESTRKFSEPRWWMTEVWVDGKKTYEIHHLSRCVTLADAQKPICFEEYDYDLGCFDRVIDRVRELVGE